MSGSTGFKSGSINLLEPEYQKTRKDNDQYYDDDIPKMAVGRLFEDYINIEKERNEANIGDAEKIAEMVRGSDNTKGWKLNDRKILEQDFTDSNISDDKEYIDYINCTVDSARKEKSRHVIHPKMVKQLTERNKKLRIQEEINQSEAEWTSADPRRVQPQQQSDKVRVMPSGSNPSDSKPSGSISSKDSQKKFVLSANLFFAASCVIVLLVLSFFVLTINSLSAQLAETKKKLNDSLEINSQYNELALQNEQLQNQIVSLTEENMSLKQQNPNNNSPDNEINTNANPYLYVEDESAVTQDGFSDIPTPGLKYISKRGDSFSKIARQAYNDSAKYLEIMEANNFDKPELQVGITLIIPKI